MIKIFHSFEEINKYANCKTKCMFLPFGFMEDQHYQRIIHKNYKSSKEYYDGSCSP